MIRSDPLDSLVNTGLDTPPRSDLPIVGYGCSWEMLVMAEEFKGPFRHYQQFSPSISPSPLRSFPTYFLVYSTLLN